VKHRPIVRYTGVSDPRPAIVFTVDVECWGQSVLDRGLPISAHAADNFRRILDLLASGGARATLFVLGKFAERHPDTIRQAAAAGHEIASHGFGHVEVQRLTPDAFREDLRRANTILSEIVGRRPRGYRAPVFSIGANNLWALAILAEEGFAYDASIYPFRGPRYGIGDWPIGPCRVDCGGGRSIVEYPLTVTHWLGGRRPVSGGGYARLLPGALLTHAFKRECRRRQHPPVFYCHPYEVDPGEISTHYPRTPIRRRLHQGLGRRGFARKLRRIIANFQCRTMDDVQRTCGHLPEIDWPCHPGKPHHQRPGRKPGIKNRSALELNSQGNPQRDVAGQNRVEGQDAESVQQLGSA
jgi:polysaccharide deacetylase family protein (PEP-CTERM system associated)